MLITEQISTSAYSHPAEHPNRAAPPSLSINDHEDDVPPYLARNSRVILWPWRVRQNGIRRLSTENHSPSPRPGGRSLIKRNNGQAIGPREQAGPFSDPPEQHSIGGEEVSSRDERGEKEGHSLHVRCTPYVAVHWDERGFSSNPSWNSAPPITPDRGKNAQRQRPLAHQTKHTRQSESILTIDATRCRDSQPCLRETGVGAGCWPLICPCPEAPRSTLHAIFGSKTKEVSIRLRPTPAVNTAECQSSPWSL